MCKKSIYKKNFLLCTIAGTLIFSHCGSTYANTQPPKIINEFEVNNKEKKTFNNVFVRGKGPAVSATDGAVVTITDATIHTELSALYASKGGIIHAKGIDANSIYVGLRTTNGTIEVEDSTITVQKGSAGTGILIYETPKNKLKNGEKVVNHISLINSKILVQNGVGIRGPYESKSVAEVYLKNSEILADVLLRNKTKRKYHDDDTLPVSLRLTADNSVLEGRARTLKINTTILSLNNNSKWHLKVSEEDVDTDFSTFNYDLSDIKHRALSTVSELNLNNSSIMFHAPHTLAKGQYQTLSVGRTAEVYKSESDMVPTVATAYRATGHANIYFNIEWSDGLPKEKQKADRLLVHGNVSGTTTVHVQNLAKGEPLTAEDSTPLNKRGLSLVQVSGETDEHAFTLANGYTTMGSSPYKYTLNAYGPTSSRGKADSAQSHLADVSQESEENDLKDYTRYVIKGTAVEGVKDGKEKATSSHNKADSAQKNLKENKDFWDFRLQRETLDDEGKIPAPVPQVASYLVMPTALFSAGFADVNSQNALINNMRTTAFDTKDHKNRGIFLSTYGNKMTSSSHRTPLQYGYGADLQYTALQAGVTLATLEDQNVITNFGLLGTYGKLAFTPKDMEGADKTTLDKWSLAAYSGLHLNNGLYINALFSYGMLKGNIKTALTGNVAELNNKNTVGASATIGQKLVTNASGLVFEPQAQFIYQHLMLGTLKDVDNLEVKFGNPHQWLVRVGGRLTQTTLPAAKDCVVSFYGKVNVMKAFADNSTVQIGDTFHLDTMGTSLEGGLGVNAQFSKNIALHADVNYQHKLQKAGVSGVNVSGGIRYQF
ncbi:autotransporter outer membrane beta-barrel domain-containing protein [Bartonella saheliensis]|uniref:autotransporter family protein n=1 Tax=Bartonella saheliensis TaxID=1457016 RepID=UPI0011A71683|nr:autotransporter outer membrane beta-barrel domain-containing protein [Bartonella saheliensis]